MKREHLPGHVVKPPEPSPDVVVINTTYTATTGLEIPVHIHMHKDGLIWKLFQEELKQREGKVLPNPKELQPRDEPIQIDIGPPKLEDTPPEL